MQMYFHVNTELKFTCLSGLVALPCIYMYTPGFVPSLLSCLGGLVIRAPYTIYMYRYIYMYSTCIHVVSHVNWKSNPRVLALFLKLVDCLELLHLPCFNCYVNSQCVCMWTGLLQIVLWKFSGFKIESKHVCSVYKRPLEWEMCCGLLSRIMYAIYCARV